MCAEVGSRDDKEETVIPIGCLQPIFFIFFLDSPRDLFVNNVELEKNSPRGDLHRASEPLRSVMARHARYTLNIRTAELLWLDRGVVRKPLFLTEPSHVPNGRPVLVRPGRQLENHPHEDAPTKLRQAEGGRGCVKPQSHVMPGLVPRLSSKPAADRNDFSHGSSRARRTVGGRKLSRRKTNWCRLVDFDAGRVDVASL